MSACKLLFIIVISTVLLCCHTSNAGPARQIALAAARASKIPRAIRAPFRNSEMMTARGFGKRRVVTGGLKHTLSEENPWSSEKSEKYFDELSPVSDAVQQIVSEQTVESFPIDWFANELATNPMLAKTILHKFVDTNRDGVLTVNELLSSPQSDSNDIF